MPQLETQLDVKSLPSTPGAVQSRLMFGSMGFRILRREWEELIQTQTSREFYHRPEWYRSVLPTLPHEDYFFYIEERGETTTAIVPLRRGTQQIGGLPLQSIDLICNGETPFCDYIVRQPGDAIGILSRMSRQLKIDRVYADVLAFCNIPANSHVSRDLSRTPPGMWITQLKRNCDYFVSGKYDDLLGTFSDNFRGNLRKARNKLEQSPGVRFEWADSSTTLPAAFEHFLKVESSGWKGDEGTAIQQNPITERFYRQLIQEFGPRGECAIFLMFLDDAPIAAQFSIIVNGVCYLMKIGYNEEHRKLAPGNMLLEQLLRRFELSTEVREINLVSGVEWHRNWKPAAYPINNHFLINMTARGMLAYSMFKGNAFRKEWHDRKAEARSKLASRERV